MIYDGAQLHRATGRDGEKTFKFLAQPQRLSLVVASTGIPALSIRGHEAQHHSGHGLPGKFSIAATALSR
jgi:hypothetical protein